MRRTCTRWQGSCFHTSFVSHTCLPNHCHSRTYCSKSFPPPLIPSTLSPPAPASVATPTFYHAPAGVCGRLRRYGYVDFQCPRIVPAPYFLGSKESADLRNRPGESARRSRDEYGTGACHPALLGMSFFPLTSVNMSIFCSLQSYVFYLGVIIWSLSKGSVQRTHSR